MAESGQPLAGVANHNLANGSMRGGYSAAAIDSGVVTSGERPHLGGSIAIGILIGAVAAFLVGGLLGVHETGSSAIVVEQTSTSQQSAP
jgi:hypothetical protein